MLVYEMREDGLYVTQVIHGFNGSEITPHKTTIQKIHQSHRDSVRYLKPDDGLVYVTGDTSVLGGGIKPRRLYEQYLDK